MTAPLAPLVAIVARHATTEGGAWLERALGAADRDGLLAACALAARKLGTAPLDLSPAETAALAAADVDRSLSGWTVDEAGRVALLVAASDRLPPAEFVAAVEEAYRHGDTRERRAVLRSLSLLPGPERFVAVGVDACRSHVQPVFEAIACENPYPARHFPDLHWNQMVLKAVFTEVPLARIVGLGERRSPDLARMAADYARERAAAGRPVPDDLARLARPERA